jgi:hypothetical protein
MNRRRSSSRVPMVFRQVYLQRELTLVGTTDATLNQVGSD